jgi:hypothetical protein
MVRFSASTPAESGARVPRDEARGRTQGIGFVRISGPVIRRPAYKWVSEARPAGLDRRTPGPDGLGGGRGELLHQVDVTHVRFHFGNGDRFNLGGDGRGARPT